MATLIPSDPGQKLTPSIRLIVEHCMQNPVISNGELATLTGRSAQFVRMIRKSDLFHSVMADRVAAKYGEEKGKLLHEMLALSRATISKLHEQVSADKMRPETAIHLLHELMQYIAPGPSQRNGNSVTIQVGDVPVHVLQDARNRSLEASRALKVVSDDLTIKEMEYYEPSGGQPPPYSLEHHPAVLDMVEGETGFASVESRGEEVRTHSSEEVADDLSRD